MKQLTIESISVDELLALWVFERVDEITLIAELIRRLNVLHLKLNGGELETASPLVDVHRLGATLERLSQERSARFPSRSS